MVAKRLHNIFAAVDEVFTTPWASGFFEKLESAVHREGHASDGFRDESISTGDGVGAKTSRKPSLRKLNGTMAATTPSGWRICISSRRGYVLEIVPLHHHGDAAGDFDVFDGAAEVRASFGESLAIFDSVMILASSSRFSFK